MYTNWESLKKVKGYCLEGIYANKLDVFQRNNDLVLYSVDPVLQMKISATGETVYWKLDWTEDSNGDDILLLNEQKTPEPIPYEVVEHPSQKHLLHGSSFSFHERNIIQKISGFGFKTDHKPFLSSIVLELQEQYVIIEACAVMDIKITDQKSKDLGTILFTSL